MNAGSRRAVHLAVALISAAISVRTSLMRPRTQKWPAPSTRTNRQAGMRSARSKATSFGTTWSVVPCHKIARAEMREYSTRHGRRRCPDRPSLPRCRARPPSASWQSGCRRLCAGQERGGQPGRMRRTRRSRPLEGTSGTCCGKYYRHRPAANAAVAASAERKCCGQRRPGAVSAVTSARHSAIGPMGLTSAKLVTREPRRAASATA